jgi:chaperonin cofactor prefoldin
MGLGSAGPPPWTDERNVATVEQKRRAEQNAKRIQALEKENEKLKKRIKELEYKLEKMKK